MNASHKRPPPPNHSICDADAPVSIRSAKQIDSTTLSFCTPSPKAPAAQSPIFTTTANISFPHIPSDLAVSGCLKKRKVVRDAEARPFLLGSWLSMSSRRIRRAAEHKARKLARKAGFPTPQSTPAVEPEETITNAALENIPEPGFPFPSLAAISPARLTANRINAQASTGAVTGRPFHLCSESHHPRFGSSPKRNLQAFVIGRFQWLRSVKTVSVRRTSAGHANRIHLGQQHGRIALARLPRPAPSRHLHGSRHRSHHRRQEILLIYALPNHPHPRLPQISQRPSKARIRKA